MADFYCADCGKHGSCEKQSIHSIPKGWVNNKTYGIGIKTYCSEVCKRNAEGASKKSSSAGANQSQAERNYVEPPVQKSAEQIRAEHEVEMAERVAVAKADKEFFDSIKKNWKAIVVAAIVIAISIGVFNYFNNNSKQNDAKLSQQLEQIEDNVKLAIQAGDKEKALNLANQLIHYSHKDMESQKYNTWSGYPKYDEYWSKKREEYKTQILALGTKKNVGGETEKKVEIMDSNIENSEQNGESEPESQEVLDPEYQETE
ncbi:hypothetical protein [Flavobacterium sp.]|jgi:hypothetical protein|uniref:hypothetical protein n=1 Tax=Flavobacterium sp. TaxID=239 RepID=UPI0037839D95